MVFLSSPNLFDMKKCSLLVALLAPLTIWSQVTLTLTSIPANTPKNATIYLAGNLNAFNPADLSNSIPPDDNGIYKIIIPEGLVPLEFKFTRGSWVTAEANSTGGYLPNRIINFTGSPQSIDISIAAWEDLSGGILNTSSSNVAILNTSFYIPQLNTYRKIWIYLPPDYNTSDKKYPVIYMHDGQNLFDKATSFSGEWEVDETLNALHAKGDFGAIVIGIENAGTERTNEYSPWKNITYGGGNGEKYMQFLAETLKPYVDSNYRTLTDSKYNVLVGSSLGGLISMYGVCKYPTAFGKVAVFSPAFWFALNPLNEYISKNKQSLKDLKIYFAAGQNESTTMVTHIEAVKENIFKKGVKQTNIITKIDADGAHTETYWKREFKDAYKWLFADENLPVASLKKKNKN